MIREVLNEPAEKKRSREDKEEGEESFYPGRPLGSDPSDFDMDSSEDSNDQPKNNKKKGKKWQGSANSAVSKAHFDAILDCGASDIFFPHIHEDKTTDIHY